MFYEDFSAKLAVVLAAGKGKRLGDELTGGLPKCLLEVGGKTILERQVESMALVGVKRVVVVVGYMKDNVIEQCKALGDKLGLEFSFVENPEYDTTNTIYSLYLARDYLRETFLYFNADVVFHPRILELVQKTPYANALAVEEKQCAEEEVKVILAPSGRILRIAKELPPEECAGEFIGVARFSGATAPLFVESLEYACEVEGKRNTFFEYALDRITDKLPLFACPTKGLPVIEIDFPEDLERARNEIAPAIDASRG